jgi:anaerobic magnesium-protoporphyrin IX monomethyl ester cyclase
MSEILLGQGYYLRFDPKLWEARQPYAPLGTLYAASYLRRAGHDVALFDAMLAASEDEWAEALDRHTPRFAVLFEDNFNYLSKMCLQRMRRASFVMLQMARARGCTTIVCGSDATDHPAKYQQAGADYVILGEGEATLLELIALLKSGRREANGINGVFFRTSDGEVRTPPRTPLRDLDTMPFPAWDLVDVERYRRLWMARHGYFSVNLATTRGCPYHCNWCAKPIYGQRYTSRRPEHVVEEMAWLKSHISPDHLWFADDLFGLKPGWIERFASCLAPEVRTPFKCLLRADLMTAQVVAALRHAGCRTVWLGAESGSQKILDAMEKGIRVDEIRDAARLLHEAQIEVGFFLQFGYPGETRADIEKTLQLVRDCRPDDIGISVSYPLQGTKFYERVKAQLGEKRNWMDSDDLTMMYHGTFSTAFYRQLHTVVHSEFRLRRAREALKRAVARPATLRPHHFREIVAAAYRGARLPVERLKLQRLARVGANGLGELQPILTREKAATPSDTHAIADEPASIVTGPTP